MDTPLIIDSFAGGGGASTGIEAALGRPPDIAINHNTAALQLHAANHPDTIHLNSNIWDVHPRTVTEGRHVGLLWASPDCKHFSKAKGGKPRDRNVRDLAWVVIFWAEVAKPDVIIMENVEEFQTWGPLCNEGKPVPWAIGQTYELWLSKLRKAGYKVQSRELRACDYGAPTIRKRWFLVARRDGRPIVWPKPTHGNPKSPAVRKGKLLPWRSAAEIIDWSISCPSIFETGAEIMAAHGVRAIRPLAQNTLARVARGMKRYVLDAEAPFLVDMSAPHLTRFNGGATGADLRDPAPTVTANSYIKRPGGAAPLGIVAPVLTYAQQGGGARPATLPHHTICANSKDQNQLLAPVLVQTGYGERSGQAPRALDLGRPLGTAVAGGIKHAAAAAFLAQQNGGPRMCAQSGRDARDPVSTVTAAGSQQTPVVAFFARHFGASTGHAADAPTGTVTAGGGGKTGLTAAFFAKYYGTGDGARTDAPCHTVTVRDRFSHVEAQLLAPVYSPEHETRARQVAEFLRVHGAWDGGEIVTLKINDTSYVIVDIGLRMLTPRELYRAQGFPDDYVIEGVWDQSGEDWTWRQFPKSVQVSCCGNSVPPVMASALASANCSHIAHKEAAA